MSNTQQKLRWAECDAACKRLLSEKAVLAKILQYCVDEFKTCSTRDIMAKYIEGTPDISSVDVLPDKTNVSTKIHGVSNEDTLETEGKITYDIRFNAIVPGTEEAIGLIINIEAQHSYNPGYSLVKRGIYYCSRMISAQHGTVFTKQEYDKIQKVYSIWICTNPPKKKQNSINRYRFIEECMIGDDHEPKPLYDLATVVMIRLNNELRESNVEIIDFLTTLLARNISDKEKSNFLYEKYDIKMTDTLQKGASDMCNIGEGIYYEGVEEGMQQGKTAERIEMLSRYLKTGATIDEAFKLFEITDSEEQEKLRNAIIK